MAAVINKKLGETKPIAHALNSALVSVATPDELKDRTTEFIAALEDLRVEVDTPAKIVVNERTGTIVMGKDVRIAPVAILHGNLSIEVQTKLQVSSPCPVRKGPPRWCRRQP